MSRTVKKNSKRLIQIQYKFAFYSALLEPLFIIYLFPVQIRNQHLQKHTITKCQVHKK